MSTSAATGPAWDDAAWAERNTDSGWPWRANRRWLQSWWRVARIQEPAGPGPDGKGRPRSAWLPLDAASDLKRQGLNFYDTAITDTVRDRIAMGSEWGGIVRPDRVYRSLLSSQPVCFNLFAYLARHPDVLLEWLTSMGLDAVSIEPTEADDANLVRIEYAPPKSDHLGSGSAFDACITYRDSNGRRCLVAIETKYAEDLSDQSPTASAKYTTATKALGHWKDGAPDALNVPSTVQAWQNALLVQKAVERRTHDWDHGTFVMVADGHDLGALRAAASLRRHLYDPGAWVRWSPYQALVEVAQRYPGTEDWVDWFTTRYLDLTPVQHMVEPDPNQSPHLISQTGDAGAVEALKAVIDQTAVTYAQRVFGDGSILAKLVDADLDEADTLDLIALADHLHELQEPIAEARRLAPPIHHVSARYTP